MNLQGEAARNHYEDDFRPTARVCRAVTSLIDGSHDRPHMVRVD
jgi:hypothetical protein